MWCHLCKLNFTDHEIFKCHIMEKHRPESEFYKDTDSEESEQDDVEASESLDSDVEIYNEDSIASSEDALQLSSDTCPDESPSKSSTPVLPEPSSNSNTPHSENQNKCELRRSDRLKRATLKTYSSPKNFDAKIEDQKTNNSKSAANNQFYIINPVGGQALGQQPMYVINPLYSDNSQLNTNGAFALNSKNLLEWLTKHKELCRNLKYPLPPQLYKKIKIIHKELFGRYCLASPSEENSTVLKVYEDLNNMILRHIACVNAQL